MKKVILDCIRRMVGTKHINEKFNNIEDKLQKTIKYLTISLIFLKF